MLIPLRFKIEEVGGRGYGDAYPDPPGIGAALTVHHVEIEFYDTTATRPVVRGYELLRAVERPMESYGSMTERLLEPDGLTEANRAYLLELRDAIDELLQSGWQGA